MKRILLFLLLGICIWSYGQSPFKYQVRLNPLPIEKFYYAGAVRLGVETVNRRWNLGLDYLGFMESTSKSEKYFKDSLIHGVFTEQYVSYTGVAINLMRAIKFKTNNNRLILGVTGFVGGRIQTNTRRTAILDTSHTFNNQRGTNNYYGWHSDMNSEITERHGTKLALGLGLFTRLELVVSKRFTFSPELSIPFIMGNTIGGGLHGNLNVGFNFCIGYMFGKINIR